MSYSCNYNGQVFVGWLNKHVVVEDADGTKLRNRTDEDEQQLPLGIVPQFELAFVQDIDLVLVTQCSNFNQTRNAPWDFGDKSPGYEHRPEGYIQSQVRENNPSSVLLISQCCGQYWVNWQKMLADEFPSVVWHFPRLDDFCDNLHNHTTYLVRNLLDAGIVNVVSVAVTAAS